MYGHCRFTKLHVFLEHKLIFGTVLKYVQSQWCNEKHTHNRNEYNQFDLRDS